MRLLIIGGSSFVGRHTVEVALDAGHDVTLANRGVTNSDLFPDLERRVIDRQAGDVAALRSGSWDATIDISAYVPRHVAELSSTLSDRAGRYVFVSTASVYEAAGLDADATEEGRRSRAAHDTEEVTNDSYGPLKVACEDVAWADFGANCTIVRPGIVAGPYDPTDRFTYWVRRLSTGDPLVVPRRPDQPVQVIDARDLGAFLVTCAASKKGETYNAAGDQHPLADFCRQVAVGAGSPDPTIEWADPEWLRERDEAPQPLTLDAGWDVDGLFRRSSDAAKAAGLVVRPVAETAAVTLEWDRARGLPPLAGARTPDQEAALVEAWRSRG